VKTRSTTKSKEKTTDRETKEGKVLETDRKITETKKKKSLFDSMRSWWGGENE